ncbi:hypothetical protein PN36_00535 [Candidatus Thiomargarita nelsonii]|uniref:Uncharacterized protein n=1 Tax=Candidatus Thiomargarita nelsonii TaxID=1003181 RepID=A0A0A6RUA3_9GAMM|nr:hypothetical protein PN36_00535 [Candidatus Thiomargarita nelsonii]
MKVENVKKLLLSMKKNLTQKAKIRAEKKAKRQKAQEDQKLNLLPYTLRALIRCQKDLPDLKVLKNALETLHQLSNNLKNIDVTEQRLSVAIAYKQDNFSDRAAAAIQQDNHILILDHEQNLILKVSVGIGKIEYQGIVFTLKQIRTACRHVQTLKAQMGRKLAEQCLATLLAEIPGHLEVKIKALQKQAEQHWDKLAFLNTVDFKFLEDYQRPRFNLNFYQMLDSDIQTQSQLNDWISGWIGRVEAAIAAPSLVDAFILTILKLIASSPKYGIQTYAMWLGNSKAKSLDDKKLDKKFRAALGDNTIAAIAAKIEACIEYKWLKITAVGTHHLPVLVVTAKGKKVLKLVKPTKQAAQLTVNIHSHLYWLDQIQQEEQTAYVNFLNSPQSIANIANWSQDEVVAIQRLLNERLKAWQVLANWKLSKHPIKYKPLQRLV